MLSKLRHKFILIMMLLLTAVLVTVFISFCVMTYRSAMDDVYLSLERAIQVAEQNEGTPQIYTDKSASEYFGTPNGLPTPRSGNDTAAVYYYPSSNVYYRIGPQPLEISDENLDAAVRFALAAPEEKGKIGPQSLYFLRVDQGGLIKISFASSIGVQTQMQETILRSIMLCILSLVVLFFISLKLAKMTVQPVQKAWDQQQQFVADASHELKTPLTVILANSNIMLAHEGTDDQERKWIESTQAEATHMRKLIDNMLFLARSDAAKQTLIFADLDLSEMLTGASLQFEPLAFEQGITLYTNIEDGITIRGDATQITQLIHILLDNACKYAGDGGIVRVELARGPRGLRGAEEVRMAVNNTGDPIPEEDIPHLFERFYRADKVRTQDGSSSGYGLGLSIAKNIVESHEGRIEVISEPALGTTFTVIFRQKPPGQEKSRRI